MDALKLRQIFEKLDEVLEHPTELLIRGGAAVVAHGLEQRVTMDIDVLPASRFIEADLRRACSAAGIGFNPSEKDFAETDYLEVVPEETLILPRPDPERGYNTIFRGLNLTVKAPPAADLVISKLKRLDPEDLADIDFLIEHFRLTEVDLRESFGRLPPRFKADSVVQDNLRFIVEDLQ
ncbi:MAG TPA: DUF6036 family nucleotidyltransferase [Thermoanaerobaculia bacterium]|jgi:hypothetical protein|nr:DUF6036 family nucleotidyltransferase [Thermoanaerobaculia bacterium]